LAAKHHNSWREAFWSPYQAGSSVGTVLVLFVGLEIDAWLGGNAHRGGLSGVIMPLLIALFMGEAQRDVWL